MLGKLLKYDLKWVYKLLIVFYVLGIIFAVLGRCLTSIENSVILNIIGQICIGTSIAMLINAIINNLIRMWVRFIRNVYKDESYLTHTLPVKKGTIFLSKVLTAVITTLTTVAVTLICLAICYYSPENIEFLKQILEIAATTYDSTVVTILLVLFAVFFLQLLFILLAGYVGIILGHKANNGRTAKSIIYGFLLYMAAQVVSLIGLFVIGLINPHIMNLFMTNDTIGIDIIRMLMCMVILLYAVYIATYYIIGKKQFEKGVNVE